MSIEKKSGAALLPANTCTLFDDLFNRELFKRSNNNFFSAPTLFPSVHIRGNPETFGTLGLMDDIFKLKAKALALDR